MKLTSYIKYFLLLIVAFASTYAYASDRVVITLVPAAPFISADAMPLKENAVANFYQQRPGKQKAKPAKSQKPVVKEVPRARPQPKPKMVGPKVKPVKIVKPKVKPRM